MTYVLRGATLSYPNLFIPRPPPNPKPGQKPRYSCMLLIPHAMDVSELQKLCYGLLKERWGDKTDTLLEAGFQRDPAGLKWPFRKDNLKRDGSKKFDDTLYKCYLQPWSENAPGLVDRFDTTRSGKPDKILTQTPNKLYAGCVVNCSVNPFVYDNSGNRGVNLGLVNVQHWDDGQRLDNRPAAEDEFQAEDPSTEVPVVGEEGQRPAGQDAAVVASTGPKGAALANLFS